MAAVGALVVGVLVVRGLARASGPRIYTAADLPKLRELLLRKADLGRGLRLCVQRNTVHSPLKSWGEVLGVAVGLFVGTATLNPKAAIAAAQATAKAYTAAGGGGKNNPCEGELQKLVVDVAAHDALSLELGFAIDASYETVQAAVNQAAPVDRSYAPGGANNRTGNGVAAMATLDVRAGGFTASYIAAQKQAWNACVKNNGKNNGVRYCTETILMNNGAHDGNIDRLVAQSLAAGGGIGPIPKYDKATGLAP